MATLIKDTSNTAWIQSFRDHMEQRNLMKSTYLLDFVLDCQLLQNVQTEILTKQNHEWTSYQDHCTKRKEIFVQIYQKYFHEESLNRYEMYAVFTITYTKSIQVNTK